MITDYNVKMMYRSFVDKDEITTKSLLELGFTNKDITRLMEEKKIKRVKRGFYQIDDVKAFSKAVAMSVRKNSSDVALPVLEKVIRVNPNSFSSRMKLFTFYVEKNDFEKAYEMIDYLYKNYSVSYIDCDLNTALFLLGILLPISDEYKELFRNGDEKLLFPKRDDVKYYDSYDQQVEFRRCIFNMNYDEALSILENNKSTKGNLLMKGIEGLLRCVNAEYKERNIKICNLIIKGNYDEVIEALTRENDIYRLNSRDQHLLEMLRDYKNISSNPEELFNKYSELLKSLSQVDINKADINVLVAIMLSQKICYESRLVTKEKELADASAKREKESKVVVMPTDNNDFSSIILYLKNKKIDEAFGFIQSYLTSIGKESYLPYVASLVKLDMLNGDLDFNESLVTLSLLKDNSFEYNVSTCLQDFYYNVGEKDFKKAAVYLEMIGMSKDISGVSVDTSRMKDYLYLEARRCGVSNSSLETYKITPKVVEVVEQVTTIEPVTAVEEKVEDKKTDATDEVVEVVVEEKAYTVDDAIGDVLNDTNLIVSAPMSEEEFTANLEVCKLVDDVAVSSICDEDGRKRLVLRYYSKKSPFIDIPGTLKEAQAALRNWEYDKAIDLYQNVLPKIENPKGFIFGNLGFCYEKTTYDGDYSKAFDYYLMGLNNTENAVEAERYQKGLDRIRKKSNYNGRVLESDSSKKTLEKKD